MIINFCKMHGLGNDFVVIDSITQGARLKKAHFKRIADRNFGIGCDQVILICPPNRSGADFYYKIFNPDGQEVEQCGNGARCAAKFFVDSGLSDKSALIADCMGGTINLFLESNGQVSVNLGKNYSSVTSLDLHFQDLPKQIHSLSVGNPHGVCLVDNLANTLVSEWGKILSVEPMFPNGANIGFMQIIDRKHIQLRVFERGAGATYACGSGACAAVLVGQALNKLDSTVTVSFAHGDLIITTNPQDKTLSMQGPATLVYTGYFKI